MPFTEASRSRNWNWYSKDIESQTKRCFGGCSPNGSPGSFSKFFPGRVRQRFICFVPVRETASSSCTEQSPARWCFRTVAGSRYSSKIMSDTPLPDLFQRDRPSRANVRDCVAGSVLCEPWIYGLPASRFPASEKSKCSRRPQNQSQGFPMGKLAKRLQIDPVLVAGFQAAMVVGLNATQTAKLINVIPNTVKLRDWRTLSLSLFQGLKPSTAIPIGPASKTGKPEARGVNRRWADRVSQELNGFSTPPQYLVLWPRIVRSMKRRNFLIRTDLRLNEWCLPLPHTDAPTSPQSMKSC